MNSPYRFLRFAVSAALLLVFLVITSACSISQSDDNGAQNNTEDVQEEDSQQNGEVPGTDESETDAQQPETPQQTDEIADMIAQMTRDEKIGQLIFAGFEGTSTAQNTSGMSADSDARNIRALIQDYHVGGLILYSKNITGTVQTAQLLNDIKRLNEGNPAPLLLGIDQEGGAVSRLPQNITAFPTMQQVGVTGDKQFAYDVGGMLGEAVAAFGFNLNFAPVLDINSNPNNPVIGNRAFGSEADIVAQMGVQMMQGMQASGVIPVIKHFPGHGDTSVDSHLQLPKSTKSLEQLRRFELVPFQEAIDQGADVVMIAHILMSDVDPEVPSSMSEKIITDLLRKEIDFDGVVITDDMTMGAIADHYSIAEAAVRSIQAGSDIVMVAHGFDNVTSVFHALKKAVQDGVISQQSLDKHVYRILQLKQDYKLNGKPVQQVDVEALNQRIEEVLGDH